APTIALLTPESTSALSAALGVTQDPESGTLYLSVYDCNGKEAAGVSFELEGNQGAIPFYVIENLPSRTAKATDHLGSGGFVNVREGSISVSGRLESTGQPVARVASLIRTKAITYQPLRPNQ